MDTTDRHGREGRNASATPPVQAGHAGAASSPVPRQRLSRERILACAGEHMRRSGPGELSMRRLGVDLGVEAMSLYRYFPSKAAMLEALADSLLRQIAAPAVTDPTGDWRMAVRAFARSFHALGRRCPGLLAFLATTEPAGPAVAGVVEPMLDMWRRSGLDEPTARAAQAAVHSFVLGALMSEGCTAPDAGTRAGASPGSFEFALDILIAGLEERLPLTRPRARGAQAIDASP